MKLALLGIISLFFSLISRAQSAEILCIGKVFSLRISKTGIGSIYAKRQQLESVYMEEKSIKAPEYENLKALYVGQNSYDTYSLYVFKDKEEGETLYTSFLQIESNLGPKKNIELRCDSESWK